MRIVFVSPTAAGLFTDAPDYTGGAEVQQFLLAQALARRGHETILVVREIPGLRPGPVRHLAIPFDLAPRSPLARAAGTRALWEALERAEPDVLVQQGAGLITLETALFARLRARRFVYVMAGDDDWARRVYNRNPLRHALFRLGVRWAAAIVTQTEHQREQVEERWGLPARVIRGGLPLPPPPGAAARERAVLWAAALRWYKRPEAVLDLAARIPDASFWVAGGAWVGRGGADARAAETFRARAAARPNVRCLGVLSNPRVLDLQRRAAVFANTSLVEGFPHTFLEAWAGGTPVVTLGVDPDEVLCRHALGFHTSDIDDMAGAIRRLLDDDALRRQMGGRAYAYVREHHDLDRIAGEYEALFEESTDSGHGQLPNPKRVTTLATDPPAA